IRHDITQLKLAEEKIKQQAIELQRSAQLSFIGELAAGLAHEIKNPLAGIQGAVDILIRRRDRNDPELEALTGIRQQVERIDGTVRALLDRARPRSLKSERTSLIELTTRAVNVARAQLAARAGTNDVRLRFTPPDQDIVLLVDPSLIEDAVLNLIINAIEALDADGAVSIRIGSTESDADQDSQDEAFIEVADTGRGISEEDLKRIFNPFFTTTEGGTGLGLPAVRRIVRVHGGRIAVDSKVDRGSTFTIHLPLRTDS